MIDLEFTAQFVADFEGFVGTVYLDAAGVETIGYGETRRDIIERYRQTGISQPDALELLKVRVQEFADAVGASVTNSAALTPNRHAAFTSFAYNIGVGGFRDSTACRRFNSGDIDGVPEAMGWWNKAGGQVLEGLSRRRAAESALFVGQAVGEAAGGAARKILRLGDRGDDVRQAQRCLVRWGWGLDADGDFGPGTDRALRAFQSLEALKPDGVLGPKTWPVLESPPAPPAPPAGTTPPAPPWPGRLLQQGVDGDDVRQAQRRMFERGWSIAPDGLFGPRTDGVVRAFQSEKVLGVDGIIGPATWQALWTAPVTAGGATPDVESS